MCKNHFPLYINVKSRVYYIEPYSSINSNLKLYWWKQRPDLVRPCFSSRGVLSRELKVCNCFRGLAHDCHFVSASTIPSLLSCVVSQVHLGRSINQASKILTRVIELDNYILLLFNCFNQLFLPTLFLRVKYCEILNLSNSQLNYQWNFIFC